MAKILQFPVPDSIPDSVESSGIYLLNSALPEELWRSVEIALMATEPSQAILFQPVGLKNWGGQWVKWLDGEFSSTIAPHLVRSRQVASNGVRELAAEDQTFAEELDRECSERSLAAGLALLTRNEGAKHLSEVARFGEKIENGVCPGHVPSVFALQCAIFNVPAAAALIAYLYLEWKTAQVLTGWPGIESGAEEAFEQMTPDLSERLPVWLKSGGDSTFQPRAVE
ncbi:MAG: urease accessory UreF family protein [Verrucomicrobiota bacterium]